MRARIFDAVAGLVGKLAEIYLPGVRGKSQHVNVCAGTKHSALRAGQHHGSNLGMLEADALQDVVEFDVHAEIVGIQFQFVARTQTAILVHVHGQRGDRSVVRNAPMLVFGRIRLIVHGLQVLMSFLDCGNVHASSYKTSDDDSKCTARFSFEKLSSSASFEVSS